MGGNSFDCEWVENRSWWFRKTFWLEEADISPFGTELFMEMLDIHADIFLNGSLIGHHASAFYPFRKDVRPWLKVGENVLLVRLTTGLERVSDEDIAPIREFVSCEWRSRRKGRGDDRRVMLRKPQYVYGWDQSPRLGTCAISGDVRLEILDEVVVRDIRFETLSLSDAGANILAEVEVESRERLFARECFVTMTVELDGKVVHTATKDYVSQTGSNFVDFSFTMEDPQLWWPNGYGAQPLYTVKVEARNHRGAHDEKSIVTGVRTVKLDTSLIRENDRNYRFIVNGKAIYCRGTDFIQSDSLYARITDAHQEKLLTAARDANFCMVRFWDGNVYQTDGVYAACDRLGLLVLQNFCFACGAYPDHLESFCNEVEKEATYQLKRLRSHPSLAVWYGNGENSSLLSNYFNRSFFNERDGAMYTAGTYLYSQLLPRLHHSLCASVDYQCTTPFGNYDGPEGEQGDSHYYPFLDIRPENQQNRISVTSFDRLKCKFVTEGGVMGPPSAQKLIKYCGGREHVLSDSPVWEHHRNTFERDAVRDGIYKHFTGEKQLTLEEYCLYGGLFQGNMLAYEADHIRLQPNCGGCVLWVLNDGFGEVGFSMMDHDGDPKPAYYYLGRAYAPNRLILRRDGDTVNIYCTNSRQEARTVRIEYGYTTFDGSTSGVRTVTVQLPAHAPATLIASTQVGGRDLTGGVFFARSESEDILSAILRADDFRTLQLPGKAQLTVSDVRTTEEGIAFTVSSDIFAYAVHFGVSAENRFSDQYFDLLPGESRRILWRNPNGGTVADLHPESVYIEK